MTQRLLVFATVVLFCFVKPSLSETLRHPESLEQQLKATSLARLVKETRRRGDPRRGALVFYKSAAACASCHASGEGATPLGPNLAELGKVTDEHVIDALLRPSKSIREGYESVSVLTIDGDVLVGMKVGQSEDAITLRPADDLTKDKVIDMDDVEAIRKGDKSLMPEGLVASIADQRDFYDLVAYIIEVAAGGKRRAAELKPSAEALAIKDDSIGLDHAGIIKKLKQRDFDAGKGIYHGYCFNCHGNDGNTPSLPTARAFGTQKLKFGSDPYAMFMTLTRGNGLMSPMSHLTPKERYQVVHYIRERFMKPSNPDYVKVTKGYLAKLPEGTKDGTEQDLTPRDYGPVLASQLRREFSSVLTARLDGISLAYDLHTMGQADVWEGDLDLSDTQHYRPRGEGTADPQGKTINGLAGWNWGHEGTLDYPKDDLLPRGPMPTKWMDYRGHYLHGERLVLSYAIDGRDVLETPHRVAGAVGLRHSLRIGPGKSLVLAVASPASKEQLNPFVIKVGHSSATSLGLVTLRRHSANRAPGPFTAAGAVGDVSGATLKLDAKQRLVLTIPADTKPRQIELIRGVGASDADMAALVDELNSYEEAPKTNFAKLTSGGPQLWPDVLKTVGYPGLERDGYALDTITIPDATPWNTWFRTSAIDFFRDGRMVVATHGGDVWIVSGVDDELLDLRWKRFAGGLYEPFGVKVVDETIYVTCKDRLTRLHDLNNDGEADFYESFSADEDVSVNFHAFNFDLQTDNEGNFYYSKSGHGTDSEIPGAVIKVTKDGKQREIFCTGFRTPNGMGSFPDGTVTASDNQGQWTPASKVSLLKKGGFYGWVNNYSIPGKWEPGGGSIDLDAIVPPETFDQPLVWMPQEFDNSSGGQVFVDDKRFGPLSGRMFHTSFGKGWLYYMMTQHIGDVAQSAIIKLPLNFSTGIMRARVNPADGQVYATGLQGWNGGGRVGLAEKGVQRVRYTGRQHHLVRDCLVESDGLRLAFNFELDPDVATNLKSYDVRHWNYHWEKSYGSDQYSPTTDKPGPEAMNVTSVTLGADGKSVKLNIPDLKPVNQVHLLLKVWAKDGTGFEEEIYWTINRVPSRSP